MSSANPATILWALDVMLGMLIDSAPASEGAPHGIPSLVMDSPAITGKERDAIASALGLIPKGLTSTEEVFDVVAYVNSSLTDNAQVMASMSTRSGTANETYGITRLATNTNGSASYFLNDGRGSVTQTVSQQGKPTSWRSYSAFGEVEASSNLGDLPSYGYNAEEQHPRTGLTYMRFRYYEAKTSTFGVQDTYLGNIFSPLTLNRYLYCLSNPVNYIDPSGHVSLREIANGIKGGLAKIGKAISKGISTIKRGLKYAGDLLRKVANKVSDVFNRALNKHKELGAHIVGSLLSNARKTIVALRNFYCGMSSFLAPIMKPITDALTPIINYTYQGVRDGVDLSAVAAEKGYLDGFLDFTLSAKKGDDGAYHIGQHYWQSTELIGYNDLYDMFLIEGSGAFGGGAQRQKYEFYYNGEKITLWTWKGDYLNLGAGSELGIYKGDYSGHTLTAPEYAMPMTLKVTNKVTGQVYTDYHPTENQWWVTGFNPSGHNTPVENLQSTVTIDFSSNPGMYEAFRRSQEEMRNSDWVFDPKNKKATLTW